MNGKNIVAKVELDDAREFVEAISPLGPYLDVGVKWIYRGHGDDTYRLVPKALRQSGPDLPLMRCVAGLPRESKPGEELEAVQVAMEALLARRFFHAMDAMGLEIPGDSQDWRDHFMGTVAQADSIVGLIKTDRFDAVSRFRWPEKKRGGCWG